MVIHQLTARHRAIEFTKFLDAIDKAVSAGLEVHVVLDNSSTHKTPAIHRWLLRHPRVHFPFTPTSSSWMLDLTPGGWAGAQEAHGWLPLHLLALLVVSLGSVVPPACARPTRSPENYSEGSGAYSISKFLPQNMESAHTSARSAGSR